VNVEIYSKNKFEKLVHLVGFSRIIRIYHDGRSPERQIPNSETSIYNLSANFPEVFNVLVQYNVNTHTHFCKTADRSQTPVSISRQFAAANGTFPVMQQNN
jgi:hypothetical protein